MKLTLPCTSPALPPLPGFPQKYLPWLPGQFLVPALTNEHKLSDLKRIRSSRNPHGGLTGKARVSARPRSSSGSLGEDSFRGLVQDLDLTLPDPAFFLLLLLSLASLPALLVEPLAVRTLGPLGWSTGTLPISRPFIPSHLQSPFFFFCHVMFTGSEN